jgi:ABC-type Fe3+/spermidine/putrescine transport system ATPase subunit
MASVQLQGVGKTFGGHIAMHRIDLDIPSGQFLTLLGPSGCGKTTTLRSIAGLVKPDCGTIWIGGENVTDLPPYRRELAMVFQSHALFPHMTVLQNVAFGLRMKGLNRPTRSEKARGALDLVGLGALAERHPHQLSGGQQQRVAIARALVVDPRVLLLDEPFGALDRKLRETMQHELRTLTRRLGITAIFVTHDQEEALILSDSIAVMRDGRIEQQGSPDQIFERPATDFVADFMGIQNVFQVRIHPHAGADIDLQVGDETIPLSPTMVEALRLAPRSDEVLLLGIRPERIRITAPGQGLTARVIDCAYAGAYRRYVLLHRSSDQRFVVHHATNASLSEASTGSPTVGDTVGLVWDDQSLLRIHR